MIFNCGVADEVVGADGEYEEGEEYYDDEEEDEDDDDDEDYYDFGMRAGNKDFAATANRAYQPTDTIIAQKLNNRFVRVSSLCVRVRACVRVCACAVDANDVCVQNAPGGSARQHGRAQDAQLGLVRHQGVGQEGRLAEVHTPQFFINFVFI